MLEIIWYMLLCIGGVGLLGQVLLGGHTGHHVGHVGHAPAHVHNPGHHAQAADGHDKSALPDARHLTSARSTPEGKGDANSTRMGLLLTLISPMTIFSLCLGAGATGLLLKDFHIARVIVILLAIAGGIIFYGLVSRPLMSLLLNFASHPSKALNGAVSAPAEVISHFDESGRGLVNITIDGQIVRVLATLEDSDKPMASEILPGDQLVVTSVDGRSNACRVTKI